MNVRPAIALSLLGTASLAIGKPVTPNEKLARAIHYRDTHGFVAALEAGADPNLDLGGHGYHSRPVFFAIHIATYEVVADDPFAAPDAGNESFAGCLRALLKRDVDLNVQDRAGYTPLAQAMVSWSDLNEAPLDLFFDRESNLEIRNLEGETTLCTAVRLAPDEVVEHLLAAGADKTVTNHRGADLLMIALQRYGAPGRFHLLLKHDLPTDRKDKTGRGIAHYAAANDQASIVLLLAEKGLPLDQADSRGRTPLHDAAGAGSVEIVRFLVEKRGDDAPLPLDALGRTPLFDAVQISLTEKRTKTLESLLAAGADINAEDKAGVTVLAEAAALENIELFEWLQARGAKLGADRSGIDRALVRAARHFHDTPDLLGKHAEKVSFLAGHAADPNARDEDGMTALMWVAATGNTPSVAMLIERGADVAPASPDGRTALHWAAASGARESMALLEKAGADKEQRDASGKTAADWLAWNARINQPGASDGWTPIPDETAETILRVRREALRSFLALGVWEAEADLFGVTPLDLAAALGDVAAIKKLVELGAPVRGMDPPLVPAAANGRMAAVEALLELGADPAAYDRSNYPKAALHRAIENGHTDVARSLARTKGTLGKDDAQSLTIAIKMGELELLRELLQRGAVVPNEPPRDDPFDPFGGGTTWHASNHPVRVAARLYDLKPLQTLADFPEQSGFDREDVRGSALHYAATEGRLATIKWLVESAGVPIDYPNFENHGSMLANQAAFTPLSRAVQARDPEVIRYLLGRGAKPEGRTNQGAPVLVSAAVHLEPEIVRLLLEKGADPNGMKGKGTALDWAELNERDDVATLLREFGAKTAKELETATPPSETP